MLASDRGPSTCALEVTELTAGYGDVPVVSNISIHVSAGEIVALLGPNGAGKSTLLKAVVNESRVMHGAIYFNGNDVTRTAAEHLARLGLGYVPQSNSVFRTLTVAENLEMGAYLLRRRQVSARIDSVMEQFPELKPFARSVVSRLSGGEQRLVSIGRALMLQPTVLLLDEPTANLSPKNAQHVLRDYVVRVAAAGAAILLVEQRAREALQTAHRAYILASGRIELAGSSAELQRREDVGRLFLGEAANSQP